MFCFTEDLPIVIVMGGKAFQSHMTDDGDPLFWDCYSNRARDVQRHKSVARRCIVANIVVACDILTGHV